GNITESPIIFDDGEAMQSLAGIADYILTNNREIVVPQDDSVIQFSMDHRQKIVIRRARGMAPAFGTFKPSAAFDEPLLAMGAMLKSTFGIYHQNRIFISQYLSNTETLDSQENFEKVLDHFSLVLDFHPARILVDMHPDYPSTVLGDQCGRELDIPVIPVQHHEAHAYSVLGENGLLDADDVLCVIWDGTGFGHDHQIWGGEFFLYRNYSLSRLGHWSCFDHLGGDRMAREPRLPLLSLLSVDHMMTDQVRHKFTPVEYDNYIRLLQKGRLKTTSTGRLFDAVASILEISDQNTYEGEAAMYLEAEAQEKYMRDPEFDKFYEPKFREKNIPDIQGLIREIFRDYRNGKTGRGEIALKFHLTLVKFIKKIAEDHQVSCLAFSGGVFQNGLLIDLIHRELDGRCRLYFQRDLSPNDENISYGQLMGYYVHKKRIESLNHIENRVLR
ncbi:MAG: carbamoyltransferase HypF, partial [Cyclobacteriaceae bacterium]|nr:carbamoyltransferase HypF [Cyclobacteriaceae bacterium]